MSWICECGDLNSGHESGCYRCGAGRPEQDEDPPPDEFTGAGSCPQEDDYLRAQAQSRYADATGNGFLLTVSRDGESSAPGLEAWAIALGLCRRDGYGQPLPDPCGS